MNHNQQQMWEDKFSGKSDEFQTSDFAEECIEYLPKNGKILELGCGIGKDPIYLAKKGFNITALDFSQEAIKKAKKERVKNIKCIQ